MRLPGNAPPSRHMVEPQSPLDGLAPYTITVHHNTYQKLEMISLPESATFLCCLGVPLVTLKPSSEKMLLLENALPPILRQSVQWQRIYVSSSANYPHPEFQVPTLPSLLPAASYATLPHMQLPETILTD